MQTRHDKRKKNSNPKKWFRKSHQKKNSISSRCQKRHAHARGRNSNLQNYQSAINTDLVFPLFSRRWRPCIVARLFFKFSQSSSDDDDDDDYAYTGFPHAFSHNIHYLMWQQGALNFSSNTMSEIIWCRVVWWHSTVVATLLLMRYLIPICGLYIIQEKENQDDFKQEKKKSFRYTYIANMIVYT